MKPALAPSPRALDAGDLCEAFARTVRQWGEAPALRSSDGTEEISWRMYDELVRAVAGGLRHLGVRAGSTVALLLTNRYEAAILDMATLHLAAVPVSLYNSSPVSQLTYLFSDSRADVVVTEKAFADRVRAALAPLDPRPLLALVDGDSGAEADVLAFEQLCWLGRQLPPDARPELSPDDLITIVYTSGTTGPPKGVELTHRNILEQIRGLHSLGRLPDGGRAVSYLPFAHMSDRVTAYYMPVISGACVTFHPDPRTAADLLPEIQPTLYMAVPRVWQRLMGRVTAYIDAAPPEQREHYLKAVALGSDLHDARVDGRDQDPVVRARWEGLRPVLSGLRQVIGMDAGELLITGAAPLPPETLRFFAAIGVDLCECYGMSETAGVVLCNPADRPRPLTNGVPLPGVEAKIASDGELLIRGPMLMAGYRGKPELTAAAHDDEGWLRTGDIFVTDEVGYFRIVDRKKEIIVSSSGKNVSPAYVENALYDASSLIATAVCIGNDRAYVTALLTLDPDGAEAIAGEGSIELNAASPAVVEAVTEAVLRANETLNGAEQVKRFTIVPGPWVPGADELTPTMKLRRKSIDVRHAAEIDALYGPPAPGVVDVYGPRT